jgi:hypothetical protein
MNRIFADAFYYIARLNPADPRASASKSVQD